MIFLSSPLLSFAHCMQIFFFYLVLAAFSLLTIINIAAASLHRSFMPCKRGVTELIFSSSPRLQAQHEKGSRQFSLLYAVNHLEERERFLSLLSHSMPAFAQQLNKRAEGLSVNSVVPVVRSSLRQQACQRQDQIVSKASRHVTCKGDKAKDCSCCVASQQ